MDPLTHGIAGALIAKAFFAGRDGLAGSSAPDAGRRGHAIAAVTLGALFPDVDALFNFFSNSPVATLEYHRWITHSVLCLPVWAGGLALGMRAWVEFREGRAERSPRAEALQATSHGGELPRVAWLALLFAAGIASHIFLDAITSWGTQLWSPLRDARTNWDWVFIIDGTLTGLLLLPQLIPWIYADSMKANRRRVISWLGLAGVATLLQQAARAVGANFGWMALGAVILLLAAILLAPGIGSWGRRLRSAQWARAGVLATAAYLGICFGAQRIALARVEEFARREGLTPQRVGALPLPPAMTQWAGLIRTSAGVYQSRFSLLDAAPPRFEFVADRAAAESLEAATTLPEVQTYLWFARFPVVETREVAGQRVVVFTDHRFPQPWASAPAPFEYWVMLDPRGRVIRQGWAERLAAAPKDE